MEGRRKIKEDEDLDKMSLLGVGLNARILTSVIPLSLSELLEYNKN